MVGFVVLMFAACIFFNVHPWDEFIAWRENRLAARVRELEVERKVHRAALRVYADPNGWIGDTFVGGDDPAAPARIALDDGDRLNALKSLPASRFASKKARRT